MSRHGRGSGQKLGCCQLVLIIVALVVGAQVLALLIRLLSEMVMLASTLLKWVGTGLAGALGVLAVVGIVAGAGYGIGWVGRKVRNWWRARGRRQEERDRHRRQGHEWRDGICTTVKQLQRRGWLSKEDAGRYRRVADASLKRLQLLDQDLVTLHSVPDAAQWAGEVEAAAQTVLDHLCRTHRALVRLLAQSAVRGVPGVDADLRDSTDELEALLRALEALDAGPMTGRTLTDEEDEDGVLPEPPQVEIGS